MELDLPLLPPDPATGAPLFEVLLETRESASPVIALVLLLRMKFGGTLSSFVDTFKPALLALLPWVCVRDRFREVMLLGDEGGLRAIPLLFTLLLDGAGGEKRDMAL